MSVFESMIAFVEAYRAGLFKKENILRNLLAGIVAAIIAIPLSMAFAIASGEKPEAGLYTSIIGVLIVSIFGGSRVQISGPTSAFIGLLMGISSQFGTEGLRLATLMAGIFIVLIGIFRIGKYVKYIPDCVIVGFTAGVAFNMLIGQCPNFLGMTLSEPFPASLHRRIACLFHHFLSSDPQTILFGILAILAMVFSKWLPLLKKMPGALVALIVGMSLEIMICPSHVATIGSVYGGLPSTMPSIRPFRNVSWALIGDLFMPALDLAILGVIESLLCAMIADRMTGLKHDPNQELVGHGFANIICPIFGGIATTGSISRTAASIKTGGNCPLAGIFSAITLALMMTFLSPLGLYIPLATLSGILFLVSYNMMNIPHMISTARQGKIEAGAMYITLLITLFYKIDVAVVVGMAYYYILHYEQKHPHHFPHFPHLLHHHHHSSKESH